MTRLKDAPQPGRCSLLFRVRDGGQARPYVDGLAVFFFFPPVGGLSTHDLSPG